MYKKVLIATDGSKRTRKAVLKGLEFAKLCGAKVTALYVAETAIHVHPALPGALVAPEDALSAVRQSLLESGKKIVEDVVAEGKKIGLEVSPMILEGSPAQEIVEVAPKFDIVVLGTQGRGGVANFIIGSVAEKVVRHAPVPVLVVRG